MIKFLQHVLGWTFSPDTVGVATVVIDDAWQSPKTKKADVWRLTRRSHARGPCRTRVETASLYECH